MGTEEQKELWSMLCILNDMHFTESIKNAKRIESGFGCYLVNVDKTPHIESIENLQNDIRQLLKNTTIYNIEIDGIRERFIDLLNSKFLAETEKRRNQAEQLLLKHKPSLLDRIIYNLKIKLKWKRK